MKNELFITINCRFVCHDSFCDNGNISLLDIGQAPRGSTSPRSIDVRLRFWRRSNWGKMVAGLRNKPAFTACGGEYLHMLPPPLPSFTP